MTQPRTAFRLAVYYRALAGLSFAVGGAIALAGLVLGLGEAVAVFFEYLWEPDVERRTLAAANVPVTVVLVGLGVAVWQVGKSAAFYWTLGAAVAPESEDESAASPSDDDTDAGDDAPGTVEPDPDEQSPSDGAGASKPSTDTGDAPGRDSGPDPQHRHPGMGSAARERESRRGDVGG